MSGDLDSTHDAVSALRTLIPEATVAGGAFDHWLPDSRTLAYGEQQRIVYAARTRATDRCIEALLQASGYAPVRVANGPDGERLWPEGLIGSISHKDSLVVGVVCSAAAGLSIGVDLEKVTAGVGRIEPLIAPEGLPPDTDTDTAAVLTFSAKEAFFKAQFPVTRQIPGFDDVALVWRRLSERRYDADLVDGRVPKGTVRCTIVGQWVLAAALVSLGMRC